MQSRGTGKILSGEVIYCWKYFTYCSVFFFSLFHHLVVYHSHTHSASLTLSISHAPSSLSHSLPQTPNASAPLHVTYSLMKSVHLPASVQTEEEFIWAMGTVKSRSVVLDGQVIHCCLPSYSLYLRVHLVIGT